MKTRKEIMTEAHEIARIMEGDYIARLSEALKISWAAAKYDSKLAEMDVKSIYEILMNGFNYNKYSASSWSIDAETILLEVLNKSKGFQKDIAEKSRIYGSLTKKQAWCIAYEYKNVA